MGARSHFCANDPFCNEGSGAKKRLKIAAAIDNAKDDGVLVPKALLAAVNGRAEAYPSTPSLGRF
jgi:hypothetical protein